MPEKNTSFQRIAAKEGIMKTVILKRIDPLSASKAVLILYTVVLVVSQVAQNVTLVLRGSDVHFSARSFLYMAIAVLGASLATLIVCILYNLIAALMGGIKVDVEE